MNCKNCNSPIPDDSQFCPSCGQPTETGNNGIIDFEAQDNQTGTSAAPEFVSPEMSQSQGVNVQEEQGFTESLPPINANGAAESSSVSSMPPKKSKKKFAIIGVIVAILAVAGVAGAMNADRISNFFKSKSSSPAEYYQYVETKNRDEGVDSLTKSYDTMRESLSKEDRAQKLTCKVEFGETVKSMLSAYGVESAEIVSEGKQDGSVVSGKGAIKLNDKDALSFNTYMDYDKQEGYVQVPELTESYLDLSAAFGENAAPLLYSKLGNIGQYLPETKSLETILERYTDVVIKNLKDVKRSEDTLEAGSVSAKYTKLTVSCKGQQLYDICKNVLEELQKDQEIQDIVGKIDSSLKDQYQDTLKETLEELETEKEEMLSSDGKMEMDVYVDGEANIVGRVINIQDSEDSIVIREVMPEKDSKFGYEFSVGEGDNADFSIVGNGTKKGSKLSGEFYLSIDSSGNEIAGVTDLTNAVTLKVTDFDTDALKEDGILKGSFELSSDKIPQMVGYSLKLDSEGAKEGFKGTLAVMTGSDAMVTLSILLEEGGDASVSKPADDAKKYDVTNDEAMQSYAGEMNLIGFLGDLNSKCGVDISSLANLIGGAALGSGVGY